MIGNPVVQNVLGIFGTLCWTVQILPQIWKSYRTKSTEGLSPVLVLLWGLSAGFLGPYVILQKLNIPLLCQPQIYGFLSLMSWGQCLYYGRKLPLWKAVVTTATVIALLTGWSVGLVFALRPIVDRGNQVPCTILSIMTSILVAIGLLPQYWEIWKRKEVVGLSIPFIVIDWLGGVFCDLSLVFKANLDPLNLVVYTLVVVMDGVIILAAVILNPRANRIRRLEAAQADGVAPIGDSGVKDIKILEEPVTDGLPVLPKFDIESQMFRGKGTA